MFFFFHIKDVLKTTRRPTAFVAFHSCPSESKVQLNTDTEITVKYWKGKERNLYLNVKHLDGNKQK